VNASYRCRLWPLVAALFLIVAVGRVYPQWVEDSLDCGGAVWSLAHNPQARVVYAAASGGGGGLTVISCDSNKVIARLELPNTWSVSYDSIDKKAYLAQRTSGYDTLIVIDGSNHTRIGAIPLSCALDLLWNPDNNRLYVSMGDENRVAVIDCRTDSILCEIPVGAYPVGLTLNRRHQKLYVRNKDGNTVSIIDMATNLVIKTLPVGAIPMSGWYSESADKYYDGDWGVTVIDGARDSVVANFPFTSGGPYAVAGSEAHDVVVVALSYGHRDSVGVIDMQGDTVARMLSVGGFPRALVWSPFSDVFYCANASSHNLSVIAGDGTRVLGTVAVGDFPWALLFVPSARRAYVGHGNTRLVYVIRDTVSGIQEEPFIKMQPRAGLSAAPNPFVGYVRVTCGRTARDADATIYSLDGRLVRTLRQTAVRNSAATWVWNGSDESGKEVAGGVYIVALRGDATVRTRVVKAR
jgi:YVTN family beta-propeller protein